MIMKCKCGYSFETVGMNEQQINEAFDHAVSCPQNEKKENATPELREKLLENYRQIAILDKQIAEAEEILKGNI